ncbi:MAG: DUF2029 domain-containing protein [Phycisphaerae bacterium]|nr:DUF2029 domain-containing protein [Phycisphaerae bacterium]MDW8262761.1 glycosyltransferase family 87 protein [Phycisphaerales bacterium]
MLRSLALFRPQALSNRFWQGGGLVATLVVSLVVGNLLLPREQSVGREMLGHDFLAFYTAGTLAREGSWQQLYDLKFFEKFQHELGSQYDLEMGGGFGPYWNPPVFAWVFAPLSALEYPHALVAWVGLNLLCAAGACVILCRWIATAAHPWPVFSPTAPGGFVPPWRFWLLVPFLMVLSMPFIQALSHGQNSMLSLLLLAGTVAGWRAGRAFGAGVVCGLLFYKPQLAAIVALMLVLTMGWRALAGVLLSGAGLLAVQELSMPGSTRLYLQQLPLNLAVMQVESTYLWERHVTLKAFWRLLWQGRGPGELSLPTLIAWAATGSLLLLGLLAALRNTWAARVDDAFGGHTRAIQRDRLIAASIASMPLLMPFYFDYDLLLLAIPLTLFASERLRRANEPMHPHDRLLMLIAAGLYLWLMVNPGLARDAQINVTVLAILAMAGLLLARACRDSTLVEPQPVGQPVPRLAHLPAPRRMAA